MAACTSTTPGTFHVTFVWPDGTPTFSQPVYVFAEVDNDNASPPAILQLAGPVEYTGASVMLPFMNVPNGTNRVVVIRIQQTSSSSSQVYYYGRSSPFAIEPGKDTNVPVDLMLQLAPGVTPPGVDAGTNATSNIVIASPVTLGYVSCAPPAACLAQLILTTATGVSVKLANELGGLDSATPQALSTTPAAGGSGVVQTGWDLNAGLSSATTAACDYTKQQQGCSRTVYAEFVDKNGFASPVVSASTILDAVPPGLLDGGTASPAIAGAGQLETLTVTANEPVLLVSPDGGTVLPPLTLTGPAQLPMTPSGAGTTFTYVLSIPTDGGTFTGSYTDTVALRDLAGNTATLAGPAFQVDTTAPVVGTVDSGSLVPGEVQTTNVDNQVETHFSKTMGYDDLRIVFDVSKPVEAPVVSVGALLLSTAACTETPAGSNHYVCDHLVDGTEPETTVSVSIKVTDAAGNEGGASTTVTFDFTPPSLSSTDAQPATAGIGQREVLTLVPSETLQTLPLVTFSGPLALSPASGTSLELTITAPPAAQGMETTSVQLVDVAGNPATVAGPSFLVDTISPAITALTVSGGASGGSNQAQVFSECGSVSPIPAECDQSGAHTFNIVHLTFNLNKALPVTATDAGTGLVIATLGGDPMTCGAGTPSGSLYAYSCTHTIPETTPTTPSTQAEEIVVETTDEAGNAFSSSQSVLFDFQPLTLQLTASPNPSNISSMPVTWVTAGKPLPAAPAVSVAPANGSTQGQLAAGTVTGSGTSWQANLTVSSSPVAGSFTVTAAGLDDVGHAQTGSVGFVINNAKPVVSALALNATRFSAQTGFKSVQLTFNYADDIDGTAATTLNAVIGGYLPGGALQSRPIVMTCTHQNSTPDYTCTYQVTGTELAADGLTAIRTLTQAVLPVTVTAIDSVGNQTSGSTSLTFDFAPPVVGFAGVSYAPGPTNPLTTVSAATYGTVITVQVTANETIQPQSFGLSASDAIGDNLVFSLLGSASSSGGTFQAAVPSSWPSMGTTVLTPDVTWTDLVGNSTSLASFQTPTIVLQTTALTTTGQPLGIPVTAANGPITYSRVPWGSNATTGVPQFGVQGGSGAASGAAFVFAYDGPDPATANPLGNGAVDATGAFGVSLSRADHAVVYVAAVDSVGNSSSASSVRNVSWTATFGSKTPGNTISNPQVMTSSESFHAFNSDPSSPGSLLQSDAVEISNYAPLSVVDGSSVVEETSAGLVWTAAAQPEPAPQTLRAMAYDSVRDRMVLFGQPDSATWEWKGNSWTQVFPVGALPDSYGFQGSLAFDALRGVMILRDVDQTWQWDGSSWTNVTPTCATCDPSERQSAAMVYDSLHNEVVLFGGVTFDANYPPVNETWIWDGSVWSNVTPQPLPAGWPPPLSGVGLAYDSTRGVTVLFGGVGTSADSVSNGTWEWNGSAWTQVNCQAGATCTPNANTPPARGYEAMVYDGVRGVTVLFGGRNGSSLFNDTWEWDGTVWTQVNCRTGTSCTPNTSTPAARRSSAVAFDSTRGEVVLIGGSTSVDDYLEAYENDFLGDTWVWNGSSWSESLSGGTPQFPTPTAWTGNTAYKVGSVVINNGSEYACITAGTSASAGGPTGESTNGLPYLQDNTVQWQFLSNSILPLPSPRKNLALAYDPISKGTLLFGGDIIDTNGLLGMAGDTWEWQAGAWKQLSPVHVPAARREAGIALASASSGGTQVMMFGGFGLSNLLSDTWEWTGTDWSQKSPAKSPPARHAAGMTYDSVRHVTVLFGGGSQYSDETAVYADGLNDTWEWNGTNWNQVDLTGTAPPARLYCFLAYDPGRQKTVLFGGYNSGVGSYTDTWEWDGSTWTQVNCQAGTSCTPNANTPLAGGGNMVYDPSLGQVILYQSTWEVADSRTWAWNGVTWTDITPSGAVPIPRRTSGLSYDSDRLTSVLFGGDLNYQLLNDTWELNWRSSGREALLGSFSFSSAQALSPTINQVSFSATAGGENNTTAGATMAAWDAWSGTWKTLATNPSAASSPSALNYSSATSQEAERYLSAFSGQQTINVALFPSEGIGDGQSRLALDNEEVTVRYQEFEHSCSVTSSSSCACAADERLCGANLCVDPKSDGHNCGGCGTVCGAGDTCQGGQCGTPSAALVNTASGRCLFAPSDIANATQFQIQDCNQGPGESLVFTGGTLQVYGACLDVAASGTTPGTVVDLYPCTGNANQQWAIQSNGEIVGVESGLCLEVAQGATNSGALVDLNTCTGNASQLWAWQAGPWQALLGVYGGVCPSSSQCQAGLDCEPGSVTGSECFEDCTTSNSCSVPAPDGASTVCGLSDGTHAFCVEVCVPGSTVCPNGTTCQTFVDTSVTPNVDESFCVN